MSIIMIENILELLKIADEENIKGTNIDIALGKYKMPMSFAEVKKQIKRK